MNDLYMAPGWFGFRNYYRSVFEKYRVGGGVFVEVGVWMGASLLPMALWIKENRAPIKLFGVDLWEHCAECELSGLTGGEQAFALFSKGLKTYAFEDIVQVLHYDSTNAALCFKDESVDFVFLDADHSREKVKADIRAWLPRVKSGGILAGHDYADDVVLAIQELGLKVEEPRAGGVWDRVWQFVKPEGYRLEAGFPE